MGGTRLIVEGVLRPDRGVPGADLIEGGLGIFPVLLRVLLTGRAGRAILGGPRDGLDGRGRVVVIVMEVDQVAVSVRGNACGPGVGDPVQDFDDPFKGIVSP